MRKRPLLIVVLPVYVLTADGEFVLPSDHPPLPVLGPPSMIKFSVDAAPLLITPIMLEVGVFPLEAVPPSVKFNVPVSPPDTGPLISNPAVAVPELLMNE